MFGPTSRVGDTFDARGGFRVEIRVAMPRDMATTTREYAQLEESFAHERKCVSPVPPGPSPRPEVSSRMHHAHRPLPSAQGQHRRGAPRGARREAREGSGRGPRRARGRGGGEVVATPSPDRRPRRRFRLARARHEAPPEQAPEHATLARIPRRTRAVVMKAKVCVQRLQQNKRRRIHPIPARVAPPRGFPVPAAAFAFGTQTRLVPKVPSSSQSSLPRLPEPSRTRGRPPSPIRRLSLTPAGLFFSLTPRHRSPGRVPATRRSTSPRRRPVCRCSRRPPRSPPRRRTTPSGSPPRRDRPPP